MKMLLMICLTIIESIKTECSVGCLSCESVESKCLLCDQTSGYIPVNSTCILKKQDNCILLTQFGECQTCQRTHKIEKGKCVKKETSEVSRCNIYSTTPSCEKTEKKVFYADMVYAPKSVLVVNCEVHFNNTHCRKCNSGFLLSFNKTKCVPKDNYDPNCALFSELTCTGCRKGHFHNLSNHFLAPVESQSRDDKSNSFETWTARLLSSYMHLANGFSSFRIETCMKTNSTNCQSHDARGSCVECVSGYTLDKNKACVVVSDRFIENCDQYDSNLNCLRCSEGFRLSGRQTCESLSPLPNCLIHNQTSPKSECLVCNSTHYVGNNNEDKSVCFPRNKSLGVDGCLKLNQLGDDCLQCLDGLVRNNDGTECLRSIPNCKRHQFDDKGMTCEECSREWLLKNNATCERGDVVNCAEFASKTTCRKCTHGFYLSGNQCLAAEAEVLRNCVQTESETPNSCSQCDGLSVKVQVNKVCDSVKRPVDHCLRYDDLQDCVQCQASFYLTSYKTCARFSPNDLCREYQSNQCQSCVDGYYLEGTKCYPVPEMFRFNCERTLLESGLPSCHKCSNDSLPVVVKGPFNLCASPFTNNTSIVQNTTDYCIDHNRDGSCRRCVDDYYVSEDGGRCVKSQLCPTGRQRYTLAFTGEYLLPSLVDTCKTVDSVANCGVYSSNYMFTPTDPSGNIVCSKCKEGHVPVAPLSPSKAHFDGPDRPTFTFRLPGVDNCISQSQVQTVPSEILQADFTNCEVYASDSTDDPTPLPYYGCHKCRFGFTGSPVRWYQRYVIRTCTPVSLCEASVVYSGLSYLEHQLSSTGVFPHLPFSAFVTCHKCSQNNSIPLFAATDDTYVFGGSGYTVTINDLVSFSLSGVSPPLNAHLTNATSMTMTSCVTYDYIFSLDYSGTFPSNCGVAMVLVNKPVKLYGNSMASLLCVACSPGYSASPSDANYVLPAYAIAACSVIENCQSSSVFNGCSVCMTGYAFEYDAILQKPKIDKCLPAVSNCQYIFGNNTCAVCRKGFIRHLNERCYPADLIYCRSNKFVDYRPFTPSPTSTNIQVDYVLSNFDWKSAGGCSECMTNSLLFTSHFSTQVVCMKNTDIKHRGIDDPNEALQKDQRDNELRGLDDERTVFIEGCLHYSWNQTLRCSQCEKGRVVSSSNLTCYSSSQVLRNCSVASSAVSCQVCREGYVLSPLNQQCSFGSIKNCLVYSSPSICSRCATGFVLLEGVCLLLPTVGCFSFDTSQLANKVLTCQSCTSHTLFANPSKSFGMCLGFESPIPNCSRMTCSDNTCRCVLCDENHYLLSSTRDFADDRFCLPVTKRAHCAKYSQSEDVCLECVQGYYLSLNTCLLNPIGVSFCAVFESAEKCKYCSRGLTLTNGTCQFPPNAETIDFCLSHALSSDKALVCEKCVPNYFLEDNKCIESPALHCREQSDSKTCKNCPVGFQLETKGEVTSCFKRTISNCAVYSQNSSLVTCSECLPFHFLSNNNTCQRVEVEVTNCLKYTADGVCHECRPGYVRHYEGSSCVPFRFFADRLSPLCSSGRLDRKMSCLLCREGYYLDPSGSCVVCNTGLGCVFCNPHDPSLCIMCKPGYYHDVSMSCIKIQSLNHSEVLPKCMIKIRTILVGVVVLIVAV